MLLEDTHEDNSLRLLLYQFIQEKLEKTTFPESPLKVVLDVMNYVQDVIETLEQSGHCQPISCRSGCSYCCHSQVNVLPVEALLIFSYVTENFSRESVFLLEKKNARTLSLTQGKTHKERVKLRKETPCMFLQARKCTIYPVRPFICRSWNSLDRNACISAYNSTDPDAEIDSSPARNYVFSTARDLCCDLSKDYNLEAHTSTIPQSMLRCFTSKTPLAKWSSGKRIFSENHEIKKGMLTPSSIGKKSSFLSKYIPLLMRQYAIYYSVDETCVEYFIYKKNSNELISTNIIVSFASFTKGLYVSKFYPEIYKELHCKYMSAACFYMTIHHAAQYFHLKDNCVVNLESETKIFDSFYNKLREFEFAIASQRTPDRVAVKGRYQNFRFDTYDIKPCIMA